VRWKFLVLGHRDYRMTLRYTAFTPETIGEEYAKALAQLAKKYRLPTPPMSTLYQRSTYPHRACALSTSYRWAE